jgi:hypothetical protein
VLDSLAGLSANYAHLVSTRRNGPESAFCSLIRVTRAESALNAGISRSLTDRLKLYLCAPGAGTLPTPIAPLLEISLAGQPSCCRTSRKRRTLLVCSPYCEGQARRFSGWVHDESSSSILLEADRKRRGRSVLCAFSRSLTALLFFPILCKTRARL